VQTVPVRRAGEQKELALIKNAGHFAAFTQPEQFAEELLTWVRPLASVPSR
jgi:pimeloyl-ACP methyl ester carboxylesterase